MVKKAFLKLFIIITLTTIFLDQLTKYLIQIINPTFNFLFLKIHYITNTGAGFGILQGQTILLAIISLIVTIFLIIYYKNLEKELLPQILYALLLGGVIGNLIDRVFRRFVIDFIDLSFWPAFNLADAAITISIIGLIWYYWKK